MRLFIAIPLPPEVQRSVCTVQEELRQKVSSGRFVPDGNHHITVRFIGESDALADIADAMHESVRDAKPFLVRLQGTGQFAHGGAHTVYISVSGQLDEFYRIHQVLESSLLDRGFVRGRGKPEPHITLARAVEDTAGLKLYVPGTAFRANSIVLYESRNVRGSMVYTPIHSESF